MELRRRRQKSGVCSVGAVSFDVDGNSDLVDGRSIDSREMMVSRLESATSVLAVLSQVETRVLLSSASLAIKAVLEGDVAHLLR